MVADLGSLLTKQIEPNDFATTVQGFCSSCLDVLSDSFIVQVAELLEAQIVEQKFDSIEDFQLQIHLPIVLTLRNNYFLRALRVTDLETIGIKEVLRVLLASKISNILKVKSNFESNFIIGKYKRKSSCFCTFFLARVHTDPCQR